ncbi:hypothetical protein SPI_04326 [Niveomyces insectorum RCEF 264]|uniref:Autophagy-related protein 28 n=1 Tax=Niveomyces insectorum RCEF 264 TaxID=1081102 RepID=A0A167VMG3_9HYPO|nr:hypothetical protein SPI_04326 [Niveomyces insectorum RCEF 264]
MASNSSFLGRFSLGRNDASSSSILPLHTNTRQGLRHKPSAYDLDELSPRPEDSLLLTHDSPASFRADTAPSAAMPTASSPPFSSRFFSPNRASASRTSPSRDDHARSPPPSPAPNGTKPRVLFSGPPPPIATSTLMYRDEEDRGDAPLRSPPPPPPPPGRSHFSSRRGGSGATGSSRSASTSSVAFVQAVVPAARRRRADAATHYNSNDSTWTLLQRRERALQEDIQHLLDVQSAGLSAGLGRGPPLHSSPSLSPGPSSDAGFDYGIGGSSRSRSRSRTPTTTTATTIGAIGLRLPTADRTTASGAVIPHSAARRTQARGGGGTLAQLRTLTDRRHDLAGALQALAADDAEEPLARELATLRRAHASTAQQIAQVEAQLVALHARERTLQARIVDAENQREAGLSGYRGALKEAEAQLAAVLRRPPVQPLDRAAIGPGDDRHDDDHGNDDEDTGGDEFLRMRPERRTAEMAHAWWTAEAQLLEQRKQAVDAERAALEEGGAVWRAAIQLVSDFEAALRREMARHSDDDDDDDDNGDDDDAAAASAAGNADRKGKARRPTPVERMRAQRGEMDRVIAGLGRYLRAAEDKGWNLLICAIGAELEAFQEARDMLQQAWREVAGLEEPESARDDDQASAVGAVDGRASAHRVDDVDADDNEDTTATPRLARSASESKTTPATAAAKPASPRDVLVDVDTGNGAEEDTARHDDHGASESDDNDVPPELLVTHEEMEYGDELRHYQTDEFNGGGGGGGGGDRHDQNGNDGQHENEVPPELLSQQQTNEEL